MPVTTAITTPTAFTVVAATTAPMNRDVIGLMLRGADAVGTLGLLAGGVGADRWAGDDLGRRRVDGDLATLHGEREPIQTSWGRTALLLAVAVVLRAVALALEPLRRDALRHPAAEVDALLVERRVAGLHAHDLRGRVDELRRAQRGSRVVGDPHAAF